MSRKMGSTYFAMNQAAEVGTHCEVVNALDLKGEIFSSIDNGYIVAYREWADSRGRIYFREPVTFAEYSEARKSLALPKTDGLKWGLSNVDNRKA